MPNLKQDPKVVALIERATANVHKFFKGERREAAKKIRELIREHAEDAKHAGNPNGAMRIKSLGADIIKLLP